jgi:alanine racemase
VRRSSLGNRPTVALIDMAALKHNYEQLRKKVSHDTKMMAVVKANAYGHGDVEITKTLEGLGCEFFGVAICEEGVKLRKGGIKNHIVVLGGVFPGQLEELFEFDLTPVVFDLDTAEHLNRLAKNRGIRKKVQIKVDTGMGRIGLLPKKIASFFQEFKVFDSLEVEAVLSHFSEMEVSDKEFSKNQRELFLKALGIIEGLGYSPPYVCMANSAAVVDFPQSHFNLIRPGLMLYGSYPARRFKSMIDLKQVMQVKTRILQLKQVPAGFPVSYGRTFVTERQSIIATIPMGYGDGLPRRLSSNHGEVLVKGRRVPIVGLVCMDLTMIDVTDIEDVSLGEEVVVIGTQGDERITAEEIAEKVGTAPYEILCNISQRVPRLFV